MRRNRNTLIGIVVGLMSTASFAADKVSIFNNFETLNIQPKSSILSQQKPEDLTLKSTVIARALKQQLALDDETILLQTGQDTNVDQTVLFYQLRYKGLQVWNHDLAILLDSNGQVIQGYGDVLTNISNDIPNLIVLSSHEQWQWFDRFVDENYSDVERSFRSKSVNQVVFITDDQVAHNALEISFFTDVIEGDSQPEKIIAFVDVQTGELLKKFDALVHASAEVGGSGPSGNKDVQRTDYQASGDIESPPTTFMVLSPTILVASFANLMLQLLRLATQITRPQTCLKKHSITAVMTQLIIITS